jgi:hypothetical protein
MHARAYLPSHSCLLVSAVSCYKWTFSNNCVGKPEVYASMLLSLEELRLILKGQVTAVLLDAAVLSDELPRGLLFMQQEHAMNNKFHLQKVIPWEMLALKSVPPLSR